MFPAAAVVSTTASSSCACGVTCRLALLWAWTVDVGWKNEMFGNDISRSSFGSPVIVGKLHLGNQLQVWEADCLNMIPGSLHCLIQGFSVIFLREIVKTSVSILTQWSKVCLRFGSACWVVDECTEEAHLCSSFLHIFWSSDPAVLNK